MRRRADVSSVLAVMSLAGDVTTLDSVCLYLVLTDRWSDGRRVRRHERSFDGRWSRRMDAVLAVTWLHKHIAPGGHVGRREDCSQRSSVSPPGGTLWSGE